MKEQGCFTVEINSGSYVFQFHLFMHALPSSLKRVVRCIAEKSIMIVLLFNAFTAKLIHNHRSFHPHFNTT